MHRMTYTRIREQLASKPLSELMALGAAARDEGFRSLITYSKKVFIPLTRLCRDVCHYCTFATTPKRVEQAYLSMEQVLSIARHGRALGCREALFTLGDRPELRYGAARDTLAAMGFDSTVEYVYAAAHAVLKETGLLPHINCGLLSREELAMLRDVAPSMGLMLESSSSRLCKPGGPHYGSPDKNPEARLACMRDAGELRIPLTSGILIGIGETREERLESLFELAALQAEYGHLQEIIVQNFVPKPGTKMHGAAAPGLDELLWTIVAARLIFGPGMSIQAPPNLNAGRLSDLIAAGINDWGGVSPLTPDHVNPESPWPHLEALEQQTAAGGKQLTERLTVYPRYVSEATRWLSPKVRKAVLTLVDADGLARDDTWAAGNPHSEVPRQVGHPRVPVNPKIRAALQKAECGADLVHDDVEALLRARGAEVTEICEFADQLRKEACGEDVTYVVNRNINYTNVCTYKCSFCAFSKGSTHEDLRGRPYVVSLEEIARRTQEAWQLGVTEVCLQGGIHPAFTGQTYLEICRTVVQAAPEMHVHAFSPLEVWHGARSLGVSLRTFLSELKQAGLKSLPGTAAEILDDEIRQHLCPDKINTEQWLDVMRTAHALGLKSTATIMFGHLEAPRHWATHLLRLREAQRRTGGFTELVPLPFVHMEAPLYRRGKARPGPTFREVLLMHAVARITLHPHFQHIQVSWPKLGLPGAARCLQAGANDLGGTLINESISRAAGAAFGQCLDPASIEQFVSAMGRRPRQRTTLYAPVEQSGPMPRVLSIDPVVNRSARDFSGQLS